MVGVDAVTEADAPIAHVLYDGERGGGVPLGDAGGVDGKHEPVHGIYLSPKGVVEKKRS